MNEIWKDIPGYEERYQASTLGNIRSLDRIVYTERGQRHYKGKLLRPGAFCKTGHVSVVLGRNTNGKPVHSLVALTFIGERPEGYDVLHINDIPTDNRLENLRYGTRTENIMDHFRNKGAWRKLAESDVRDIKKRLAEGKTGASLAREYGVSDAAISAIKTGKTFGWVSDS